MFLKVFFFDVIWEILERLRILDPPEHFISIFEVCQFIADLRTKDPVDAKVFEKHFRDLLKDAFNNHDSFIIIGFDEKEFSQTFDAVNPRSPFF